MLMMQMNQEKVNKSTWNNNFGKLSSLRSIDQNEIQSDIRNIIPKAFIREFNKVRSEKNVQSPYHNYDRYEKRVKKSMGVSNNRKLVDNTRNVTNNSIDSPMLNKGNENKKLFTKTYDDFNKKKTQTLQFNDNYNKQNDQHPTQDSTDEIL